MTTAFDTLKYAETLQSAGFTEVQAKGQAQALAEVLREGFGELATKTDLASLRTELMHMEHRNNERMDAGDARLLERINTSHAQLLEHIDANNARLLERLEAGDTRLLERMNKVEERVTRLEGRTGLLQWMIGFCIALVVAVLGMQLRGP